MSPRRPLFAMAAALAVVAAPAPADALQFATSSTTGKGGMLIPIRQEGMIGDPIGFTMGLRVMPGLSDLLGPGKITNGAPELGSVGADLDLGLLYRYTIADINLLGRFNPSIAPFVGWRALGAFTFEGPASLAGVVEEKFGTTSTLSMLHGPHYGMRADTELPLGFSAYSHAGFTTFIGGTTMAGGATMPMFGVGAAWGFGPFFRIAVGYDVFQLPTDFRSKAATLGPGRSTINNLNIGINLVGFSF